MMRTPVGLVAIALSAATLFAGTFLLVTGTRGQNTSFESSAGQLDVKTFASGLVHPWALAFLPDGKAIATAEGRNPCLRDFRQPCRRISAPPTRFAFRKTSDTQMQ